MGLFQKFFGKKKSQLEEDIAKASAWVVKAPLPPKGNCNGSVTALSGNRDIMKRLRGGKERGR